MELIEHIWENLSGESLTSFQHISSLTLPGFLQHEGFFSHAKFEGVRFSEVKAGTMICDWWRYHPLKSIKVDNFFKWMIQVFLSFGKPIRRNNVVGITWYTRVYHPRMQRGFLSEAEKVYKENSDVLIRAQG